MKYLIIIIVFTTFFIGSCKKESDPSKSTSDSFMPLHIGNYWRNNDQNYTEIQDTVRIKGELYYKLFSRIGGDVLTEDYYRIDENQNLISSSPRYPEHKYTEAKFNANVGDSFQTLGDKSVNDYKVTVVEKTDSKITFSFDMIYHPNLKGHPHTTTYLKGLGWDEAWNEIRINGKVIKK